jgi:hypothetical protein
MYKEKIKIELNSELKKMFAEFTKSKKIDGIEDLIDFLEIKKKGLESVRKSFTDKADEIITRYIKEFRSDQERKEYENFLTPVIEKYLVKYLEL